MKIVYQSNPETDHTYISSFFVLLFHLTSGQKLNSFKSLHHTKTITLRTEARRNPRFSKDKSARGTSALSQGSTSPSLSHSPLDSHILRTTKGYNFQPTKLASRKAHAALPFYYTYTARTRKNSRVLMKNISLRRLK